MEDDRVDSRLPYLALVIGMLAISTSAILIRFSNSDPLVIGSYRQTFATLLFVPFLIKDKGKEITTLPPQKIAEMSIAGILLGGHFGFFISSVKATSIAASVSFLYGHTLTPPQEGPKVVSWIAIKDFKPVDFSLQKTSCSWPYSFMYSKCFIFVINSPKIVCFIVNHNWEKTYDGNE